VTNGSQSAAPARPLRLSRATQGPELLGKVIDQRFRVLSHIGSGGMADVYEVEHVTLGRKLALKVLRQTAEQNAAIARRFNREARALSRIASEHVVSIFDYGILPEGHPFFVMELLRGQTLRAALDAEQRLTVVRACNLAIDICLGMHAAHQAGLVHRDLKPENLWLTRRDDGREACILLDFGVARVEGAHTTSDGVLIGTARYMSPEQIGSDVAPGAESDVFALGVILYECLGGVSPFAADTLERTLFRILNEAPRPVRDLAPDTPPELEQLLLRALDKQRSARFPSALETARALLPFAGPFRQLPGLAAGSAPLASVTLAEDDAPEPRLAGVELAPTRSAEPPRASQRVWGVALATFLLGAGLGALLLRAQPAPPKPASPPPPTPASPVSDAKAPIPLPPAAAEALSSSVLAEPPVSVVKKPRAAAVLRSISSSPAPSSEHPGRTDPPQPTFDGRNPYRP
jgi:serine/threonine-protein kinase